MSKSFKDLGMTQEILLVGIDALSDYQADPTEWSGKVYLLDPRDNRPWDLKPTLRIAAQLAGIELLSGFTSDRYRKDLLSIGICYIHFDIDRKRQLGLRGNDISELLDEHTLHTPNGIIRNGALDLALAKDRPESSTDIQLGYEAGTRRTHLRIERNIGNARRVKEILGLKCQTCGFDAEKAFGRDLAMSCIEAHHLVAVADTPKVGRKVRMNDFAVLCAICHRLIHRMGRPDELDAVRELVITSLKR